VPAEFITPFHTVVSLLVTSSTAPEADRAPTAEKSATQPIFAV